MPCVAESSNYRFMNHLENFEDPQASQIWFSSALLFASEVTVLKMENEENVLRTV